MTTQNRWALGGLIAIGIGWLLALPTATSCSGVPTLLQKSDGNIFEHQLDDDAIDTHSPKNNYTKSLPLLWERVWVSYYPESMQENHTVTTAPTKEETMLLLARPQGFHYSPGDDAFYVVGKRYLEVLDAETGKTRWGSLFLNESGLPLEIPWIYRQKDMVFHVNNDDGYVQYVYVVGGNLLEVNATTKAVTHKQFIPEQMFLLKWAQEEDVVTVNLLDQEQLLWTALGTLEIDFSFSLDGRVLFRNVRWIRGSNLLYKTHRVFQALNTTDGTVLWERNDTLYSQVSASTKDDGSIYVGQRSSHDFSDPSDDPVSLYKIDAVTGNEQALWKSTSRETRMYTTDQAPLVMPDESSIFLLNRSTLWRLTIATSDDLGNATMTTNYTVEDLGNLTSIFDDEVAFALDETTLAIANKDGSVIFAGGRYYGVRAMNATDGSLLWESLAIDPSWVGKDDMCKVSFLKVGPVTGNLYVIQESRASILDAQDGSILHTLETPWEYPGPSSYYSEDNDGPFQLNKEETILFWYDEENFDGDVRSRLRVRAFHLRNETQTPFPAASPSEAPVRATVIPAPFVGSAQLSDSFDATVKPSNTIMDAETLTPSITPVRGVVVPIATDNGTPSGAGRPELALVCVLLMLASSRAS